MATCATPTHRALSVSSAPTPSEASTLVDSDSLLRRYEHVLAQLAQQTIAQQAEIDRLRNALAKKTAASASRRHHSKKRHHIHSRSRHRRTSAAAPPPRDLPVTAVVSPFLPPTPELSSIHSADEAAASRTPPDATSLLTPLRAAALTKADHSHDSFNGSHSGGLSPSPPHPPRGARRALRTSFSPSSTPEGREPSSFSVYVAAGHDGRTGDAPTPHENIDAESALDFLLSVFSPLSAATATASSPPDGASAAARRLLYDVGLDDVSSSTTEEVTAVAGDAAVDATRCSSASVRDCSASELVGQLIDFFTVQ